MRKLMLRILICAAVMLCSAVGSSHAQSGVSISTAIYVGDYTPFSGGVFTDIRNSASYNGVNYTSNIGQPSPEVYYRFNVSGQTTFNFSLCGSDFDTYIHILNANGSIIYSQDDSDECGTRSNLNYTLGTGTYYLAVEGYSYYTGTINLVVSSQRIELSLPPTISYPPNNSFKIGSSVNITPVIGGGSIGGIGQSTTTLAGSYQGYLDGTGTSAQFNLPTNVTVDAEGNIYIADTSNKRVRKITPSGVVTTYAGNGTNGFTNGAAGAASFSHPTGMVFDSYGNLYVSDQYNHAVRKITPSGTVSTFAGTGSAGSVDGTGSGASFNNPLGLACDGSGNIYVADYGNHKIRKITPFGVVSTFAGTGAPGANNGSVGSATFRNPIGLALDVSGDLYVADRLNYMIRKISLGVVSTLAGSGAVGYSDGPGGSASFNRPTSIAIDGGGNLYVTDENNHLIRKISPQGAVSTLAGLAQSPGATNGNGSVVRFNTPYGISIDGQGNLYVADEVNHLIRKIAVSNGYVISPALPSGLSFDINTGVISGVPTAIFPTTTYTVTASNAFGSNTSLFTLTINNLGYYGSVDQNFITEYISRESGLKNPEEVMAANLTLGKVKTTVQYIDALGKLAQTVVVKGNGNGTKDLIQPKAYDLLEREPIKYQAYTSGSGNTGDYRPDALAGSGGYSNSGQKNFYSQSGMGYKDTQSPYAIMLFENSPLGRILEKGNAGDLWQPVPNSTSGHTEKTEYSSNNVSTNYTSDGFAVRLYTAEPITTAGQEHKRTLSGTGYYASKELSLVIKKDENWKSSDLKNGTIEEYSNSFGKTVLKRVFTNNNVLSTYYVYDDLGNLSFVLPPGANADETSPNQLILDNFCYQYRYDGLKRVIEQKIPGKGWDHMVYDKLDQLVLTQDSVQRTNNKWLFTKYDAFGRSIINGIANSSASRENWQILVNNSGAKWEVRDDLNTSGTGTGYSNLTLPAHGLVEYYYVINYYDNYAFYGNIFGPQISGQTALVKGLLTGSKENVLATNAMLLNVNYYDPEGRIIQNKSQNYKGGVVDNANYDIIENTYSFTSELVGSVRKHYIGGVERLFISSEYVYDHMGRKKDVWQNISTTQALALSKSPVLLSRLDYNELGDLASKNLHSTNNGLNFIQKNEYSYNERGWITKINDPDNVTAEKVLGMELIYGNKADTYNGNIGAINWQIKVPNGLPLVQQKQSYTYDYDKLNRLGSAKYVTPGLLDKFNEEMSYDGMGNIIALRRKSAVSGYLNDLTYSYLSGGINANRLLSISDAGTAAQSSSYTYDGNGNQKTDSRKGLEYSYNYLNLPQTVTKSSTGESVNFVYSASGKKLRKVFGNTSRDYIKGIEYNDGVIDLVLTEQGRALPGAEFSYEYIIKDHLGNTRAAVKENGDIVQVQDYYAFGMEMPNTNTVNPSPPNQYKYNGKEKQLELGIDQLDYVNRFYDPLIGRFNSIDKLAASYPYKSPYDYAENRPINGVDLDGLEWASKVDPLGNTHISVNVIFNFAVDPKLLPTGTTVTDYQVAINSMFNQILKNSNSTFSGSVTFNGGDEKQLGRVVPSLTVKEDMPPPGAKLWALGSTTRKASDVNIYNTQGKVRSLDALAIDASHELFHTLRLEHPFDKTQTKDTKLISLGGNNYETTPDTNPDISYNLMNYNLISIDNKKLFDLWKSKDHTFLTPEQLKFIVREINLQMSGSGTIRDDYYKYWDNTPGTPLFRK